MHFEFESRIQVSFKGKITGDYAIIYWPTIFFNVLVPQLMWSQRLRLNQGIVIGVALGAIIGMWLERYEIVVMSLRRSHLPSAWGNYHATICDWLSLLGSVGLFASDVLLAVRFFPAISMFEMHALIKTTEAYPRQE